MTVANGADDLRTLRTDDGVELAYRDLGTGHDVVILVHGQGASYRQWNANAEVLAATGRRVLVPDLRGHHFSATPPSAALTMRRLAEDIRHLADEVGAPVVHLAGWSLGGLVVQRLVHDHPARVASLCLVNTFADWLAGGWFRRHVRVPVEVAVGFGLMGILPRSLVARGMDRTTRKLFAHATLARRPELVDICAEDFARNAPRREIRTIAQKESARFDSTGWLPDVRCPALIVAGGRDHVPEYMPREMHRLLPEAELAWWPELGHMIPIDDPAGFNEEYVSFLDRVGAGEFAGGAVHTRTVSP